MSEPSCPARVPSLDRIASLTRRELDVFRLMPSGPSNRDLAQWLFVTERTVRAHLCSISRKLGGASRLQIALVAYSRFQDRSPSTTVGRPSAGAVPYRSPRLISGRGVVGRAGCA